LANTLGVDVRATDKAISAAHLPGKKLDNFYKWLDIPQIK
jgi:hypothetical protein